MVLGYIRAYDACESVQCTQQKMIETYCKENNLVLDKILLDSGRAKERIRSNAERLKEIGYTESWFKEYAYPAFDDLMLLIAEGNVTKLLVDTKLRLRVRPHTDHFFMCLCAEKGVEIIEVGTYLPDNPPTSLRAAVYHDTEHSTIRSIYTVKDFDSLYNVVHLNGWTTLVAVIDENRGTLKRHHFIWLMENLDRCDIMVVKSLLNIATKSAQVIQALLLLKQNNVTLYTLSSGEISIRTDNLLFDTTLKAVVYDSFSQTEEETELFKKIADTFVECKTKWTVQEYFCEGHRVRTKEGQNVLYEVLKQQHDFDVIIVQSFRRVCVGTTGFEKILHMLDSKKMIYSIEEGGYLYGIS